MSYAHHSRDILKILLLFILACPPFVADLWFFIYRHFVCSAQTREYWIIKSQFGLFFVQIFFLLRAQWVGIITQAQICMKYCVICFWRVRMFFWSVNIHLIYLCGAFIRVYLLMESNRNRNQTVNFEPLIRKLMRFLCPLFWMSSFCSFRPFSLMLSICCDKISPIFHA